MTLTTEDALALTRKMRMNITQLQAQLTDVMESLAALPATADQNRKCPTCGILCRGPLSLAEHLHTSHNGPLPDAWIKADALAGITDDPTPPRGQDAIGL